jgi:hypothetical protein
MFCQFEARVPELDTWFSIQYAMYSPQLGGGGLRVKLGRFLSGGIILGSPLSCPDLFLYTITLPVVSCDAPATLSYTALELASRVLLSSKKSANYGTLASNRQKPASIDDKSTLDAISREGRGCVAGLLWVGL